MRGSMRSARCSTTPSSSTALRQTLKSVPDLTRALTRLTLGRGGPRDLNAIARAIAGAQGTVGDARRPRRSATRPGRASPERSRPRRLSLPTSSPRALDDEPPLLSRDGGFVRRGYDAALDAERALASETRAVVAALQARLIAETDVKSLKIRHNGQLGYFVEVPAAHGMKLVEEPLKAVFIHRQTMSNAMRFTTAELAELEGRIARAHEKALEIEIAIFARLVAATLAETEALRAARRCPGRTRCHGRPRPSRRDAQLLPPARSMIRWPSTSKAAATRWSKPP